MHILELMLHHFTYLLFKLKLIQPSPKSIQFWMTHGEVEKIEFALLHGNYKTRKLAAEALEVVGTPASIPVLLHAINDSVQNVSIAALNALEHIGGEDKMINAVIKKRFNWATDVRLKKAKKDEANKNRTYKIRRWERASKKSFERVKEQLKRPMR